MNLRSAKVHYSFAAVVLGVGCGWVVYAERVRQRRVTTWDDDSGWHIPTDGEIAAIATNAFNHAHLLEQRDRMFPS